MLARVMIAPAVALPFMASNICSTSAACEDVFSRTKRRPLKLKRLLHLGSPDEVCEHDRVYLQWKFCVPRAGVLRDSWALVSQPAGHALEKDCDCTIFDSKSCKGRKKERKGKKSRHNFKKQMFRTGRVKGE